MGHPIGESHLQKIIPIRVSVENWEQIKKEANRMGIGVSTLTRIWVMERLGNMPNGTHRNNEKKDRANR